MTPESRVFVSYARADGEESARSIHERLCACGVSAWFDREGMSGGRDWWRQIVDALNGAAYLVLITTPAAVRSAVVQAEWKRARRQGVCVVPVSVPGLPLDFGAMPRWMRRLKVYDPKREWDALVAQLRSLPSPARAPYMAPELARHIPRARETEAVIRLLLDPEREPLPAQVALRGAAGFGKSTLAAAVCASDDVQWAFDDGILWVELGPEPNVVDIVRRLFRALTGEAAAFRTMSEATEALREWLEERQCLIVVDDVWRSSDLQPFFAGGSRCARIVTTQRLDVAVEVHAQVVDVSEMSPDEAVQLLASGLEPAPEDRAALVSVVRRLGEWPLLLVLANAAIRQRIHHTGTLPGALEWIAAALHRDGPVALDRKDATERNAAVARSLSVSFQFLTGREHRCFLELAIFPPAVPVTLSAARALWGMSDFEAEATAVCLADLSLVRLDLSAGTFTLHQAIRDYGARLLGDAPPVHARLVDGWGAPHCLPDDYAWRWYGWHLVEADRTDELRHYLLNFEWIRRKTERVGVDALLDDFARLRDDDVITPVRRALELSRDAVVQHPVQMAVQLSARLHRERDPAVVALRDDAARSTPLVLLTDPLDVPGGRLIRRTILSHAVAAMVIDERTEWLITGHEDGLIAVRSLITGMPVQWLNHAMGEVTAMQPAIPAAPTFDERWAREISALLVVCDRRWLVSGARDGSIRVWDLEAGRFLRSVASKIGKPVTSLAAPADGAYLVAGYDSGDVVAYDGESGRHLATLEPADPGGYWNKYGARAAVRADGQVVLVSRRDGTLAEWSSDNWSLLGTIEEEIFAMGLLAVAPEWCHAVTAGQRIAFFDLETGEHWYEIGPRDYRYFRAMALTPDGMHVLVGAEYGFLVMYNTHSAELVFQLYDVGHSFHALAVLPDGRTAVSASGSTLQLWDIRPAAVDEPPLPTLHVHGIRDVAISESDAVAVSISEGYLATWTFSRGADGSLRVVAEGQDFPIDAHGYLEERWYMYILPGGWRAISMYACGSIIMGYWTQLAVWDRSTREFRLLPTGKREWLSDLQISDDGRFCWARTRDDKMLLGWDLHSGSALDPAALEAVVRADEAGKEGRGKGQWNARSAEQELDKGVTLDVARRTVMLADSEGRLLHAYTADYDITRLRVLRVGGIPVIVMGDACGRVHVIDLRHVLENAAPSALGN